MHVPHVVVLYSAGANNLGDNLDQNIAELSGHYLPTRYEDNKVILVSQRLDGNCQLGTAYISRLYQDDNTGAVKSESLTTLPSSVDIANIDGFVDVFSCIKSKYPVATYSMIFSSHAHGWLPVNYTIPSSYFSFESAEKSFGESAVDVPGSYYDRYDSIDIREFAERTPVHFECIIFDACLMGGAEVAYEFRNVAEKIVFSPAEIAIGGIEYNSCLRRLLDGETPDYDGLCRDFVEKYRGNKTATISMVECRYLDSLANLFKTLSGRYDFSRKRDVVDYANYCFTDLYYLADAVGLSSDDMAALTDLLKKAVPYRYCYFNNLAPITQDSFYGLCVFNPYYSNEYLYGRNGSGLPRLKISTYYKTLEWNKATGFVK